MANYPVGPAAAAEDDDDGDDEDEDEDDDDDDEHDDFGVFFLQDGEGNSLQPAEGCAEQEEDGR